MPRAQRQAAPTDHEQSPGSAEGADPADHARDSVAHLQAAARELIAAGRAMLDAAEEVVADPTVVSSLADALGTIVRVAGSAVSSSALSQAAAAARGAGPAEHDEPRVTRIRVN